MDSTQGDCSDDDLFGATQEEVNLTQAPTIKSLQDLYAADPESVSEVGIVSVVTKSDGSITRSAEHFFLDSSNAAVTIGAGHNPLPPLPDIVFKGMGDYGMSNIAVEVIYSRDPTSVTISSSNRQCPVTVTRNNDDASFELQKGEKQQLYAGDCFTCSRIDSNGDSLQFQLLNGPAGMFVCEPSDNAHRENQNDTVTALQRRYSLEVSQSVQRLQLLQNEINDAKSVEELNKCLDSHLPVVASSLQNVLPNLFATDDANVSESSTPRQPKRKRAINQERRRAASDHKRARRAQEDLARTQLNPHNKGRPSKRTRAAASTLSKANNTVCRFWQNGNCKLGDNCLFLHPSGDPPGQTEPKTAVQGEITDWKSRPTHAFGFITTHGTTYYCSARSLPADMKPAELQLPIKVTFDIKPKQNPGKHAEAINVTWD